MSPEQNLDEDILQCRAEIQRALGQDMGREEDALPPDSGSAKPSDVLADKPDPDEVLIQEPASEKEEELIEDWIEEDINSNSGSFANLSLSEDPLARETAAADTTSTNPIHPPAEEPDPSAEPKKLFFPKDLDTYHKVLKTLKEQKENLSQTCNEQEKHILDLAEQAKQLRLQYQQALQKAADLAVQVRQLSEFQETSRRLRKELDQTLSETEKVRQELASLRQRHQETVDQKKQQSEQYNSQMDRLRTLDSQHEGLRKELESFQKKNEDLIRTIASLNQENEQLRQEKTSLRQQVFSLQEGLSRQQMESQKAVALLREELAGKTDRLEQRQQELDRLTEELRSAQARIQSLEQIPDRQPLMASEPQVYYEMEAQSNPQDQPASPWLSEESGEPSMPRFDLSDRIRSPQRLQNSGRRQPPSAGRTSPADNIRNVVRQFVAPVVPAAPSAPVRKPAPSSEHPSAAPAPSHAEFQRPPRRQAQEQPPLIAQIVQRDIESFCKQNQWIFIEFPSG